MRSLTFSVSGASIYSDRGAKATGGIHPSMAYTAVVEDYAAGLLGPFVASLDSNPFFRAWFLSLPGNHPLFVASSALVRQVRLATRAPVHFLGAMCNVAASLHQLSTNLPPAESAANWRAFDGVRRGDETDLDRRTRG
jgi:hypothetical protein